MPTYERVFGNHHSLAINLLQKANAMLFSSVAETQNPIGQDASAS